jgi:Tol biopolymer transport system component
MEFGVTLPNNVAPTDGAAISPDGRQIAANVWTDTAAIWMASLDGSAPRPVSGGELGSHPFWSPDSSTIAFFRISRLVTMRASGGPVTTLAEGASDAGGGSWSRVALFTAGNKLLRVSASGGATPAEVPLTGIAGNFRGVTFLPDGRHFIVCTEQQGRGLVSLASLDGAPVSALGESDCPGGFAPPDRVLFVRGSSLLAQKLDPEAEVRLGTQQAPTFAGRLSPDGKWLTYSSFQSGVFEVFVERFPAGSPRKQVSNGGGAHPRWTDRAELVYWVPPGHQVHRAFIGRNGHPPWRDDDAGI